MLVDVFWNRRRSKYSISVDGVVVGHADYVSLVNATARVSEALFAYQWVAMRSKTHAWITGELAYLVNFQSRDGEKFVDPSKIWNGKRVTEIHTLKTKTRELSQSATRAGFFYTDGSRFERADLLMLTPTMMVETSLED